LTSGFIVDSENDVTKYHTRLVDKYRKVRERGTSIETLPGTVGVAREIYRGQVASELISRRITQIKRRAGAPVKCSRQNTFTKSFSGRHQNITSISGLFRRWSRWWSGARLSRTTAGLLASNARQF
jgi:hypothetical protein